MSESTKSGTQLTDKGTALQPYLDAKHELALIQGLIVVGMSMAPAPVRSLLAAIRSGERHVVVVLGMFLPELHVGVFFAIVPVMVILMVAIVNAYADRLRCRVRADRHWSDKSSSQEK